MFGNWDPVGDVQKGMNDAQEKVQEGMQVAGKATGEAQNQTQEGAQNAAEQMNQGANRFKEDAQKGMTEVGENVKDGVEQATKSTGDGLAEMHRNSVEEPLRKLAEAIDGIINSALPGAAPKEGSPYEHIPGNPPHESILLSATLLDLKDGSVLRGLCQKADGSWNPSEIELNHHYAVTEGKLTSDGAGFMDAGHNFWLEPGESSVMLKGKLNDSEDQVEVDLSICIVVKDGQFAFERHDGPWGRDGVFARKFERLPVAGYIIAAIQAGSGNEDHTQRALARCTSSTIVTIAAVAGALLHGPLGGGIAAGLAAPLGMLAESHIANGIEDPRLRDEFEEATIGRAIVEALTKTIGGEAGGYALEYTSEWLSSSSASMVSRTIEAIKGALSGASLGLAQDVINSQAGIAESLALALIGKIALALKGDESALREWTNVCGLAGTKN